MSFHPAKKYSFEELRAGLDREVEAGNLVKNSARSLTQYHYNRHCTYERAWNDLTLIARGIILGTDRIVALPFPKFFNYGEMGAKLPDEPYTISEKIDGSLAIIYHHEGEWLVNTGNSFVSRQAAWAHGYLHDRIERDALHERVTYLAEIVYPQNRIVVKYDFLGLVLLSAYHLDTFEEIEPYFLDAIARDTGFRRPLKFNYSVDYLKEMCSTIDSRSEGFVVKFESGLRVKFKGDEYCRLHRLVANITPLGIWNAMMNKTEEEKITEVLPEEFIADYRTIERILDGKLEAILDEVKEARAQVEHLCDKELASLIASGRSGWSPIVKKLIFASRKEDFLRRVDEVGRTRRAIFTAFRPVENQLEGYTPSSAMNLFLRGDMG